MKDHSVWPAARGYRMPAEWARHQGTWLSWPHNRDTWPGCFDGAEAAMVGAVTALAESEPVHINVLDDAHAERVRRLLWATAPPERIHLHRVPTNDAWVRDHGAIFVTHAEPSRALLALDFDYNAWGGKYPPYDLDRRVARRMAEILGLESFAPGIVLEGGSIDVNGSGAVITTEQCLLNPNRNPGLSREAVEDVLRAALGIDQVIWLGSGIEGDDTDGHVDDITRFVAEDRVLTAVEADERDANHAPLAENRRRLEAVRLPGDRALEVIDLPMPDAVYHGGERLPASYANFYIANESVLLPVFGCGRDDEAREIVAGCFPGRRVVPIDCRILAAGLGALHCLTQQVPVPGQTD